MCDAEWLHDMQADMCPLEALVTLTGQFQSDGNRVKGLKKSMSYSSSLGNTPKAVLVSEHTMFSKVFKIFFSKLCGTQKIHTYSHTHSEAFVATYIAHKSGNAMKEHLNNQQE